jgi:hypothetical protein
MALGPLIIHLGVTPFLRHLFLVGFKLIVVEVLLVVEEIVGCHSVVGVLLVVVPPISIQILERIHLKLLHREIPVVFGVHMLAVSFHCEIKLEVDLLIAVDLLGQR